MTNNATIRLVTFAVIIFCFFAMFLTASLSMRADLRPAAVSDFSPAAISAGTAQTEAQLSTLSAQESAGAETPTM